MIKKDHSIWCEAYRPQILDDYIGNDDIKEKIAQFLEKEDLNHLLLHGPPGTGKTSLAKLISNTFGFETLYINASDENSVDTIRDKVKSFVSTISFNKFKIVILDEADFISINGLAALRNLMETFSSHARFILTCNYIDRIIPAIQSRCQSFQVTPPNKKDVATRLAAILKNEEISYELNDIVAIVNDGYPDIRKVINLCQQQCIGGKLTLSKNLTSKGSYASTIVTMIKSGQNPKQLFSDLRQFIADSKIKDFSDFYRVMFDSVDEYGQGHIGPIILILAEFQYKDSFCVQKDLNTIACLASIISEINKK